MTDVTDLAAHRALAKDDCHLWTPKEMLQFLVRALESGEISADVMVVAWCSDEGPGVCTQAARAKITRMQICGLLDGIKHDLLSMKDG